MIRTEYVYEGVLCYRSVYSVDGGTATGQGRNPDVRITRALLYAVRDRPLAMHCRSVEVAVLGLAAVVCLYQSGEAPGLPRGQTDTCQGMNGVKVLFDFDGAREISPPGFTGSFSER